MLRAPSALNEAAAPRWPAERDRPAAGLLSKVDIFPVETQTLPSYFDGP